MVDQLRMGNEAAFEAIYDRYHRPLLGYCRHLVGSVGEAEDAIQQTFVAAHRTLGTGDRVRELRRWLYAVARNACISLIRKRADEGPEPGEVAPSSSQVAEDRAEVRAVIDDLALLPEDQRSALVLSELGDLSHGEVATVIGCKRPRVKSLVHQARGHLFERRRARDAEGPDGGSEGRAPRTRAAPREPARGAGRGGALRVAWCGHQAPGPPASSKTRCNTPQDGLI